MVDSGADDDEHHHQPAVALETEIEEIAAPDGALDAEEARKAQEKRAAKKLVKEETSATGGWVFRQPTPVRLRKPTDIIFPMKCFARRLQALHCCYGNFR